MDGDGDVTAVNTFGADGLVSRDSDAEGDEFYTFDPQGAVAQRRDSSGNLLSSDLYDGFGSLQATTGDGGDVFGFGGQWGAYTDAETGLVLMTHRYYDPQGGRFLTRDPQGIRGGVNLYAYAGNNPVNHYDPSGYGLQDGPIGKGTRPTIAICVLLGTCTVLDICKDYAHHGPSSPPGTSSPVGPVEGGSGDDGGGDDGDPPPDPTGSGSTVLEGGNEGYPSVKPGGVVEPGSAGNLPDPDPTDPIETTSTNPIDEPGGASGGITVTQTIGSGGAGEEPGVIQGCFSPGTLILMADGTMKPIEKVKVNDRVISRDPKTARITSQTVTAATSHVVGGSITLIFSNGEKVVTTGRHPFYIIGRGAVAAAFLRAGMMNLLEGGRSVSITSVQSDTAKKLRVFNFTVKGYQSYFVGKTGIWVGSLHAVGPTRWRLEHPNFRKRSTAGRIISLPRSMFRH